MTDGAAAKNPRTCDNCRKRKVRCVEGDTLDGPCQGCEKLSLECTHLYVKKKPGRKNNFALSVKAAQDAEAGRFHPYSSPDSHVEPRIHGLPIPFPPPITPADTLHSAATYQSPNGVHVAPLRVTSSFTLDMDGGNPEWLGTMVDGGWSAGAILGNADIGFSEHFPSEQAHLLSLETSPESVLAAASKAAGPAKHAVPADSRESQIEDVTTWGNISHFISLFLRYLYPLEPLVHRPTFSHDLATRRDKVDSDFRALLLSIVTYVISQLPTSRLVSEAFDVDELKRLQRRCHRACRALQRTYYGATNLVQITTIIFETFYLLSIGLGHTAAGRLGQAIQLAFSMGLHDEFRSSTSGLDAIEVQLRRRVFWQLYASDKTRAIPGFPMLLNDFQGVCPLPEAVDDEYITSQGIFPQPHGVTSVLVGFVSISQVFHIISECFFHHRCIQCGLRTTDLAWTADADRRLHAVLHTLPPALLDPASLSGEDDRRVFGMQRANILITAAIAKFALYDLRAILNVPESSLARERQAIAREIHSLLMNIPVEDMASNGESVRCKVFHIACALVSQTGATSADQDLVRDWCNMFSAITFVQMPPAGDDSDASATPTQTALQPLVTV